MTSQGIILEGVTGAGKTHTMKALLAAALLRELWPRYDVYREKETFGEFMGELIENPNASEQSKFRLLAKTIRTATARAERTPAYRFIMERVHYSYYALMPDWNLFKDFDEQLARLNPHVFLLWIPQDLLKKRSLYRGERRVWSDGFINLYGSESAALEAIRTSQLARYDAIRKSAIPHTIIETGAMDWERYAHEIVTQVGRFTA